MPNIFYGVIFSKNMDNFISRKMSHEKLQSNKNYNLFIVGIDGNFFLLAILDMIPPIKNIYILSDLNF